MGMGGGVLRSVNLLFSVCFWFFWNVIRVLGMELEASRAVCVSGVVGVSSCVLLPLYFTDLDLGLLNCVVGSALTDQIR